MSELNRVVEERLAGAETAASSAGNAASAAQSSANAAQSTADAAESSATAANDAVMALQAMAVVHTEGSEPESPKNGDTWLDGAAVKMRCNGLWFTITGSFPA